jgi:hypothetical protein
MGLFHLDEGVNPQTAKNAGIPVSKTISYNRRRARKEREYNSLNPKPDRSMTQKEYIAAHSLGPKRKETIDQYHVK